MQEYTVVINGKPEGPFSIEALKTLSIKPGTFIRKLGMDDYKEAHEFAELRELLGFKFQQTAPQYFASFDQRLFAVVVDYFLIIFVYIVILTILYLFVNQNLLRIGFAIILWLLIPLAKFIYSSIAEASDKQATIGKRLMDIKVTDEMGNRISLANSIGRNAAKTLSVLPLFFGYLYSFISKKNQCFHDLIANTLVTKQRLI